MAHANQHDQPQSQDRVLYPNAPMVVRGPHGNLYEFLPVGSTEKPKHSSHSNRLLRLLRAGVNQVALVPPEGR